MTRPGGHNRFSVSDEMSFWSSHLNPGDIPDPEPAAEQPEPDIAEMSLQEFAANREHLGIRDRGDIFGVKPWRRPANQPTK